jgi:hypothetical protein
VEINGVTTKALLDTGSEVTTVIESWANQHLKSLQLQPTHVKLRAVNGAEVPYSGVLLVDLEVFGRRCTEVPVLVVRDPIDPSMLERKRRLPVLLGMNVLGQFSDNVSVILTCLQAVIHEAHVDKRTSVKGLARVATDTFVPALSMATVRVTSTPDKRLLYA